MMACVDYNGLARQESGPARRSYLSEYGHDQSGQGRGLGLSLHCISLHRNTQHISPLRAPNTGTNTFCLLSTYASAEMVNRRLI